MADEKEPRDDPAAETTSPRATKAKVVKDDAKRVKRAEGTKRTAAALATDADDALAEIQLEAEQAAAVTRAEEIMDQAGERVGQLLRSSERVGQFLRDGSQQLRQQKALAPDAGEPPADTPLDVEQAPAVARAEEIMDQAGERLGQLLRAGGQQVHRTTALAREAVEDFFAEAESIRRGERSSSD